MKKQFDENRYKGLNIFKEAKLKEKDGFGYRACRFKRIWQNKKCTWSGIDIQYGIRWSDNWQIFPIWNTSNNCQRSLLFGFWLLYFEIAYKKKGHIRNFSKLPFHNKLWKLYNLIF